jgi:hypothetical protein
VGCEIRFRCFGKDCIYLERAFEFVASVHILRVLQAVWEVVFDALNLQALNLDLSTLSM